jgi:imidazolonepropionase-like amidohydrolase
MIRSRWTAPLALLAALASRAPAQEGAKAPAEQPEKARIALLVGKILPAVGDPIDNGVILVADGKIEKLGKRSEVEIPAGYEVMDHSDKFAMPGIVETHCHIAGSGDLNDMVYQTNPDLRVVDQVVPNNEDLKNAVAGGVTTVCYIPGSGTNMGGWGAIVKTGPGRLEDVLVRFPGCLKIAQAGNPERRDGTLGSGRIGMNYMIRSELEAGRQYVKAWDDYDAGKTSEAPPLDLRLEYFKPLFHREIPLVVHTQAYQVIQSSLRILHDEMGLKPIIAHACFDSYKIAEEVNKRGIPVISGPRGFWYERDDGAIHGIVAEFDKAGTSWLGVNTDSPVIPQEELPFQASMGVRFGWNEDEALQGLTIAPARALMIDKRVGSLEPGKDADIVISTGSILDPRHFVTKVLIDGKVVYDISKDRRRF